MRFAVDGTLGKLAKWLRLLGFDTWYRPTARIDELEGTAVDRILLTKTRSARSRRTSRRILVVEPDDPTAQLQWVVRALKIDPGGIRPYSRCLLCNTEIEEIDRDQARGRVPDYVWETARSFHRCRSCRRIYWPGSHTVRSRTRIRAAFEPGETRRADGPVH